MSQVSQVVMPKATAMWLIDHTSLTFEQIASFCAMHYLEVKAMADGETSIGIVGQDPIAAGQLTWEEIERCSLDSKLGLVLITREFQGVTKGARYTPISKRRSKPDAIAWLLRTYPQLSDRQIGKLIGTTKPTITAIRNKSHRSSANLHPSSPVHLGLCDQQQLEQALVQSVKTEPSPP